MKRAMMILLLAAITGLPAMFGAAQTGGASGLVLWNTLGSNEEVLNSVVGPDLSFYTDGTQGIEVQGDREYVPGKSGNGVTLQGSYRSMDRIHNIVLNNLAAVINPEQGSIELWYYQTAIPAIFSHGAYRLFGGSFGIGGGMGLQVIIHPNDPRPERINFHLTFGGTGRQIWYPAANVPLDEWVHVAASWDRNGIDDTSETMQLYINGDKVASTTVNDWGTVVGSRVDICGGQDQNISGKFIIDELKIWNYAKTNFFGSVSHHRMVVSGWSFGGSLNDLVDQIELPWWPGVKPPPEGTIGVKVHVGDPFTLRSKSVD